MTFLFAIKHLIDTIIEEDLGIRIDLLNKYIIRLHNYGLIEYKEKKIEAFKFIQKKNEKY